MLEVSNFSAVVDIAAAALTQTHGSSVKLSKNQYRILIYLWYLQEHNHSGPISAQWFSKAARVAQHKLNTERDSLVDMGLISARRTSHGYEYRILT